MSATGRWISGSGLYDEPCGLCSVRRFGHSERELGHAWEHEDISALTDAEVAHRIRVFGKEGRGEYTAPLPPPLDRKRIRVDAGWSQLNVAEELHISRHTVMRYERRAGYRRGKSLPGREPTRALREAYATLLQRLDQQSLSGQEAAQVICGQWPERDRVHFGYYRPTSPSPLHGEDHGANVKHMRSPSDNPRAWPTHNRTTTPCERIGLAISAQAHVVSASPVIPRCRRGNSPGICVVLRSQGLRLIGPTLPVLARLFQRVRRRSPLSEHRTDLRHLSG